MALIKTLPNYILLMCMFTACNQARSINILEGMVYLNGGEITIGNENAQPNEAPVFRTDIEPFFIDKTPVTVAQFRVFVDETGYTTDAEKFGNSGVLNIRTGQWVLAEGANWKYPYGRDGPKAEGNHPVTQVSWNDANAYAEWAGRRLPTEIEWEYAAKGGKDADDIYSWGNNLQEAGIYKANVWQGSFPIENTGEDGFFYTNPVGEFGENEAGLTDMGGNVWEWTSSTYKLYKGNENPFMFHPENKVIRGGSFLCVKEICHGFRVSARQFNSRESATFHMGFRTAKDWK